jgi:hypothetical protein
MAHPAMSIRQKKQPIERAQWLTVLEIASQSLPDEINEHWEWLIDQLGLSCDLFPAVLIAIQQGRWRTAQNPRAYIRVVARREAKKLEPIPSDNGVVTLHDEPKNGKPFSFDVASDQLLLEGSSTASKGAGGIWRRGSGRTDDHIIEDEENPRAGVTYREFLFSHVPQNLKHVEQPPAEYQAFIEELNNASTEHHYEAKPSTHLDWAGWAAAAGFDEWEYLVLTCKLDQVSRERALSEQSSEKDRKALQAAWRRFDRTGMDRLREAAKKVDDEMSRNAQNPTLDR